LTTIRHSDNFIPERTAGENRSIDRVLRGLKLHAQGRQFGGQNSRTRRPDQNRSRLFLQGAAPSKSRPMENSSIPNSSPATGPISTPSSARSKNSNNCARPSSSAVHRWTLDVESSPRRSPSTAETGWAFAFYCSRRVKGAWWSSPSSKPLSVPHTRGRGRFDSYPLRLNNCGLSIADRGLRTVRGQRSLIRSSQSGIRRSKGGGRNVA
jgi:hypothetical protein